jgi:hypothetical protein
MKNDIDVGKEFKAKTNITSSLADPTKKYPKEVLYVEQGEKVTYLGLDTSAIDEDVVRVKSRTRTVRIEVAFFNSHFERA